jgi:hypothetical protein
LTADTLKATDSAEIDINIDPATSAWLSGFSGKNL